MCVLVQTLQPFAFNLTVIDFSNNRLGDTAVKNLFYTMGTHQNPAKYVQSINLSNNFIGDYGANYIAESLKSGRYPATKYIDISGNSEITDVGKEKLATAVNETLNPNLAITLEKHNDSSGVWNFVKKAFNYYSKEHSKVSAENGKAALAIYGDNDWANCKKLIDDASKEMSMGLVKHSSKIITQQLVQKAPPQIKGATVGAIFVAAGIDTALAIDVGNLSYCIAAINKKVENFVFDKDTMLLENSIGFVGENGVGEDVDF